ncbi:glycosyltransferase [Tessaracoccus sp. SD287]|uniref:glycosyltransferase n=1 Tax=Tessaracoccus sp. SD287 TaxID=2782008 RepID=UPI001A974A3C|nr:glycosyltransferase [Tessaracoccus sp. SD287]
MQRPDVSVVIGFRDWGTERIRRSAESIRQAFGAASGEIIISDYGSVDPEPARIVAEAVGAKYVYTPGDPLWSRSRALNAGFKIASGAVLISTDADMLFSPDSIGAIAETARNLEHCALFLQCRDLPSWMGDDYFADHPDVDWALLEKEGRLRPRWGMGGMMAISSEGYAVLHGFDERLHTYGGEDLDFAKRARRAGYRTVWVDDPRVRMYHMFHPPTLTSVEQTAEGRAAVQANRDILMSDGTYVRNLTEWRHMPAWTPPMVSVVIATKDRVDLLMEAVRSVLVQSAQDFEIVVVDDGSEEDVQGALASLGDNRIRYFRQEAKGISAARNLGLDVSRGYFTAVLDDDDLMPPQRLEWQVSSITDGYVGSAGSFINFDDETGELHTIISKHPTIANAAENGGAPGHGTWLLRTDVMRSIRYDESIPSGIDNNFFLRLLRSGYRVKHSAYPVLMRRQHGGQVTVKDAQRQGDAAKQALQFFKFGLTKWHLQKLAEDAKAESYPSTTHAALAEQIRHFLPDQLVERDATLTLQSPPDSLPTFEGDARMEVVRRQDEFLLCHLTVRKATYPDLIRLRALGGDIKTTASGTHPFPEGHWVAAALDDFFTVSGAETAYVYRENGVASRSASSMQYSITVGASTENLSISPAAPATSDQPRPWMVVGLTTEEYWA